MQNDSADKQNFAAAHRFNFTINEDIQNINQIYVFWNGKGVNTNPGAEKQEGATLYIWNYSSGDSGAYETLDSNSNDSKVNLTGTITSNIGNYINENGYLIIIAEQNFKTVGIFHSKIYTDYVKLATTQVTTVTYDFNGTTFPSSTHVARYDVDDAELEPATDFDTTGSEFSNESYNAIYSSDDIRAACTATLLNISQHIFRFKVDISEVPITQLTVSWEGYTTVILNSGVSIWDGSSWEAVSGVALIESTVSKVYTTNVGNYIDDNGYLFLMANGGAASTIYTDYVKLEVTYTPYYQSGNLKSIAITPENLISWDKFYANDTLPPGTNIIYKILNATDNSMLCTITSAQANAGYDISFITATSIRLYAELSSSNSSKTPVLHDWNVSYYSDEYQLNDNIISCSHDCGNATDFGTISWRADEPLETNVTFQIRTADTEANLSSATWYGPTGIADYYTTPGTSINVVHDGDRWIQYKAYLKTTDLSKTPVLHDVTITYYR
jgi:hypothetical protein